MGEGREACPCLLPLAQGCFSPKLRGWNVIGEREEARTWFLLLFQWLKGASVTQTYYWQKLHGWNIIERGQGGSGPALVSIIVMGACQLTRPRLYHIRLFVIWLDYDGNTCPCSIVFMILLILWFLYSCVYKTNRHSWAKIGIFIETLSFNSNFSNVFFFLWKDRPSKWFSSKREMSQKDQVPQWSWEILLESFLQYKCKLTIRQAK